MKLLIENTDSQYWTGESFGPMQRAVRFHSAMDLPLMIQDNRLNVLYLRSQELDEVNAFITYHTSTGRVLAYALPDDNVSTVQETQARCPDCEHELQLYITARRAARVCTACEYSEEVKEKRY